jgi:hypothetical protein
MYTTPMIFPLDLQGEIYLLQDEKGNTVGTGSRQVCEVLLHIITKPFTPSVSGSTEILVSQRPNVRAAVKI